MVRAAISQQGTFSSLLAPGTYRVEVQDLLGDEELETFTRALQVQATDRQQLTLQPN